MARIESEAISLVAAEPALIPGLVQTEDYIRAVMVAGNVSPEQVEPKIKVRIARQNILTTGNQPKFDMIVDESALRRVYGGPKVMARQLRALLAAAELPNVRLWVLPFKQTRNVGLFSPFYLMNFPKNDALVYLEIMGSGIYLEDAEKISRFRRQAAELGKIALNPAESAKLVGSHGSTTGSEMPMSDPIWRKSSRSGTGGNCVELATSAVRDSKNPDGPVLSIDVTALVAAVKAGRIT